MKSSSVAMLCRALILSMLFVSYQSTAGMIGTDQVRAAPATQGDRVLIQNALSRADVVTALKSMGVETTAAHDRVAMLTDDEARSLAGKLDSVPAGADSEGWWIAAIVVVGLLLWWRWR
jgi:hypothetical protein